MDTTEKQKNEAPKDKFSTCLGRNIVKTYKSLVTIGMPEDGALVTIKKIYEQTSAYSNGTGQEIVDAYNALILIGFSKEDAFKIVKTKAEEARF